MGKIELAIEVVTKLWGWTHDEVFWYDKNGNAIWRNGAGFKLPFQWGTPDQAPKYLADHVVFTWAGVGYTQELMAKKGSCLMSMHGVNRFMCMDGMCMKDEHSQDWVLWEDEELEYPEEHFWSIQTAALLMVEQLDKAKA